MFTGNFLNSNGECEIPVCSCKCDGIVVSVKSIQKVTQQEYFKRTQLCF